MTQALSSIDKAVGAYKRLRTKIAILEKKKAHLQSEIRKELGERTLHVGQRGVVSVSVYSSHKTNYELAKELLDADTFYQIISEFPVERVNVN